MAWVKGKATGLAYPSVESLLAKDWEEDDGSQNLKVIAFPERKLWALRHRHPDTTVLHRYWTTEITIGIRDEECTFQMKLSCSGAQAMVEAADQSVPKIIKTLGQFYNLGRVGLHFQPTTLGNREELDLFRARLESANRLVPIVLLTEHDRKKSNFTEVRPYGVEPLEVQKKFAGLAEVYCLPYELRFEVRDVLEKEWSAFNGAVRVYYPGLTWDDDLHRHPVVMADTVRYYRYRDLEGFDAFVEFLKDSLYRYNQSASYRPGFTSIREVQSERATFQRTLVGDDTKYIELLEAEVQEMNELLQQKDNEIQFYLEAAARQDDEIKELKELLVKERAKNGALLAGRAPVAQIDPLQKLPSTYLELADWVQDHFEGRVELHTRAKKALKAAVYKDLGLVCRAIAGLATTYVEMRRNGGPDTRRAWEEFLRFQHIEQSKSVSDSRLGEDRSEYEVEFRGKKQLLEWHLKTGTSRDEREALRIYFFYLEDAQQVVIGWLPSHLNTRAT